MSRRLLLGILVLVAVSLSLKGDEENSEAKTVDSPNPAKKDEVREVAQEKVSPTSEQKLKPLNLKQKIKVNANIDLPQDI